MRTQGVMYIYMSDTQRFLLYEAFQSVAIFSTEIYKIADFVNGLL